MWKQEKCVCIDCKMFMPYQTDSQCVINAAQSVAAAFMITATFSRIELEKLIKGSCH